MLDWLATTRLRPVLTVFGLSGLLALAACGGGSGAPNNPYVTPTETPALTVAPTALTAYAGVPATVTITSGVAPFFAFSSNSTVLPVAQNVAGNTIVLLPNKVLADTDVTITVQDSAGQTKTVAVTVKDSPIFNALTFAPSGDDCGTNLCSGQTGTATVLATGPGGSPLVARQIRFDVVFGPVGIMTTNPGFAAGANADGGHGLGGQGGGRHPGADQRDDATRADPRHGRDVRPATDRELHGRQQHHRNPVAAHRDSRYRDDHQRVGDRYARRDSASTTTFTGAIRLIRWRRRSRPGSPSSTRSSRPVESSSRRLRMARASIR